MGMPYTILMLEGHSLDGRPISQMTRRQIYAYILARNIKAKEEERMAKRAERKARMRR